MKFHAPVAAALAGAKADARLAHEKGRFRGLFRDISCHSG
ncbi:Hypothetical protein, conserved [Brucella abortus str. 2308 A]|uniref:Uncharacterized protein n=4 Tax=Brucella TaxID=234 RepID=Q57D30_BRUAB|nr:hypothetical protein BruAb1_1113 [Brucella abortus bv. 1 str. 9-941]ACD72556.1 hypothetical protein BAbS19_I10490 [Brucella abortus S19]ACU48095.1 hypothetical protein BMI_I1119 [Brucella microti CCM 4915]AEK54423.1 hypothetical protein BPI_I1154 [Brucella pinnipedialis B2/94]EEH14631.1 Hypothetical protein, conserved [Brucella ceti str. Cudo]EEP63040.1 Hypothetical protein, conserved [Brucella abortus str. 2308 A]